jgi:hypothetical protein
VLFHIQKFPDCLWTSEKCTITNIYSVDNYMLFMSRCLCNIITSTSKKRFNGKRTGDKAYLATRKQGAFFRAKAIQFSVSPAWWCSIYDASICPFLPCLCMWAQDMCHSHSEPTIKCTWKWSVLDDFCAALLSFEKGLGANHACILHDIPTKSSYTIFFLAFVCMVSVIISQPIITLCTYFL